MPRVITVNTTVHTGLRTLAKLVPPCSRTWCVNRASSLECRPPRGAIIPQRLAHEDVSVSGGFRKWGGREDTAWLHRAGFTRRNTRRAILAFLRASGRASASSTSPAVPTACRWAFSRSPTGTSCLGCPGPSCLSSGRRTIPHEWISWVRADSKPWGARLALDSLGAGILGNLEEADAERTAA